MRRRAGGWAALAWAVALPALAGGSRTSSLNWVRTEGAEECIASRPLAESVERILGRAVFTSASGGDVAVEGRVERLEAPPRWKAILRISDEHGAVLGDRELETRGPDCHELDDPLAFVIALMIDPDAAGKPPPAAAPPATAGAPWQIRVEGDVAGSLGLLPNAAVGPAVHLSVGPRAWAVELSGIYLVPQTQSLGAGAQAAWSWAAGGVSLCPRVGWKSLTASACAGVDVGALSIEPQGSLSGAPRLDPVALAVVGAKAQLKLASRLFASLGVAADVPLGREQYSYVAADGSVQPLFRMSAVAGTLELGIGVVLE